MQLALKEGKITAAQTEWAKEYALKDADGFKKFMEKAVAVVPQGKMALKDAPTDNTKTDDVDMAILKNCGISKPCLSPCRNARKALCGRGQPPTTSSMDWKRP